MNDLIKLSIQGMTCSGCTKAVSRALSAIPGVAKVQVELDSAVVEGDADPALLVAAVVHAGFNAAQSSMA